MKIVLSLTAVLHTDQCTALQKKKVLQGDAGVIFGDFHEQLCTAHFTLDYTENKGLYNVAVELCPKFDPNPAQEFK